MRCGSCNLEFTLKEQAKAKGCCPSCGEKLPADAYRDDAKAWRWYQYHSPMPLSIAFAYIYLYGVGGLALTILLESVNLRLWKVTDPAGWLSVITAALIFLLPFFALFFMSSARRSMCKCKTCNSEFSLWKLAWKKGCCPSCGEKIPVLDYCSGVPDRRWWRLFRGAPLGLKISAIILALFSCFAAFNFLSVVLQIMVAEFRWVFVRGVVKNGVVLLMFFHMLKAVVRGRAPCVCIMALGALGLWEADSFYESLVILILLASFSHSFLLPASRRWARKIREENLAYWIAARSGAFPFRRMVVKCILKKVAMGVLLLACLWLWVYGPESIAMMDDWLKCRSEEVASCLHSNGLSLREGVYRLPRYNGNASTWVVVKKGSGAGEFTIVRRCVTEDVVDENGALIEAEEYDVRQLPNRERLKVLRMNEYSYRRRTDVDVEQARENGEIDRARDSVLLMVKGDILIVNGLAYALVRRAWTEYDAQRSEPLPEGRFYPTNLDWQRVWVDIKKGNSEGEFIVVVGGSNGAMEPYDVTEYTVRQHPNRGVLEILKASEYTYEPRLDGDPVRTGGRDAWQKRGMLIVKGDFLIVDGFVYSLRENWQEIDE